MTLYEASKCMLISASHPGGLPSSINNNSNSNNNNNNNNQ